MQRVAATTGAIDLESVEGVGRALEIALCARDRAMFGRLMELRRVAVRERVEKIMGAAPRARKADPAACRRDLAKIAGALAAGGRRAAPTVKKEDAVDRAAREGRLFGFSG